MRNCQSKTAGYSLIEAMVALAVGSLVFGLILTTLINTQRASDRLSKDQQVRQEALLISQSVERVLRYRVSPGELAGANSPVGGAGQPSDAAGGSDEQPASNTLPASMGDLLSTETIKAMETATPAETPAAAASPQTTAPLTRRVSPTTTATLPVNPQNMGTSVPASIQPLLTTGTSSLTSGTITPLAQTNRSNLQGAERFSGHEVVVYSLSAGPDPTKLVTAIRNATGPDGSGSNTYLEHSAAGNTFSPGTKRRSLGLNPDRFFSQVSFRFADKTANATDAVWQRDSQTLPRLVEYTVRVWPALEGSPDFENAKSPDGRPLGFQLTSAVALP